MNGLVVDSTDMFPSSGATVYIKDEPGIGSITNSEGRFKLTAKLYNTLAVSFMGYETAEQIITSAADVKITLREGNQMEEVVVIGMGTQRKVSVTGAVAVVDTKDLELPATNIVNTLGGRVPGVISIQSSGEPGRNISEFWVRGIGTFGANSGALVLIGRPGRQPEPDRPGRRRELLGAQGRRRNGRLRQPRCERRGARDHQAR